jgi:hypothetical protein
MMHLVLTPPSRAQRRHGDNNNTTITATLLTHHDRDCHGSIITTRPLMLTVAPAWRAPHPHPALGTHAVARAATGQQ